MSVTDQLISGAVICAFPRRVFRRSDRGSGFLGCRKIEWIRTTQARQPGHGNVFCGVSQTVALLKKTVIRAICR